MSRGSSKVSTNFLAPSPRYNKKKGDGGKNASVAQREIITEATSSSPSQESPKTTTSTAEIQIATAEVRLKKRSYRALSQERKETRVLILEPREHEPDLRCSIHHKKLISKSTAEAQSYVAISYAWGDTQDTEDITIDGRLDKVPRSLYGALQAVTTDSPTLVWADYLCINQNDTTQRSSQVSMMDEIYHNAESVAIWLGPEPTGPDGDMLAQAIMKTESLPSFLEWLEYCSNQDPPYLKKMFLLLALLFSRSYFQRLWVAIEIFNANRIDVFFGTQKVSWTALRNISSWFQEIPTRK